MRGITYLRMVFPQPAIKPRAISDNEDCRDGIFTFSVNPEQGTRCLPVSKGLPFDAPRSSTLVVSFGRSVEVRRPIGGMDPPP